MVTITLYAEQKKRHRCTEQAFKLYGRRQGWDVLREQHWNKYTIMGETDHQPWLDACSGLVNWEEPEGWDGMGGGRGDRDGEHMLIHGWFMSMYGKNHYNIISLQLIKANEKKTVYYWQSISREFCLPNVSAKHMFKYLIFSKITINLLKLPKER